MAPMDVWDNQIIATIEYMTENAKRAKAILLAQNDPEAVIPYEELANKYRWAQRIHLQSTSSSTYDGPEPQIHPKEKAPAKQAPKLLSKAYPGGNKIESRPKAYFSNVPENNKVIYIKKNHTLIESYL